MSTSDLENKVQDARAQADRASYALSTPANAEQRSELSTQLSNAREAETRASGDLASAKQQQEQEKARKQEQAKKEVAEREQQKRDREPFSLTVSQSRTRYFYVNPNGQRIELKPIDRAREAEIKRGAAEQDKALAQRRADEVAQGRSKVDNDRRFVEMRKPGPRTLSIRNYSLEADALRERDTYLADRISHTGINHRTANNGERLQGKLVGEKTIGNDRHSIIEHQREGKAERVLVRGTLRGASLGTRVDVAVSHSRRIYEREHFSPDRAPKRSR
ncbi:hypothetical protein [Paraburkholderia fungorum]|uniref:hypothetical protein n=1 Tax=Paraburkholderia fungorum TaxID=134537 RepID=UPI0038B7C5A6